MGQNVTVSGRVVNAASFSGGFRFTLDDGAGRITLLLWHNVYDDCWDAPELNLGAMVRASGEIGQYEGDLQIVPDFGGDVKVTTPGGPLAPQRDIGALGNHVGERVTISGAIIRVEGTGSGVKLFVGDDTGEVAVFIWQNILERIPNNTALGDPGTAVQVTGHVQTYRGNREVAPTLPYDVVVSP
jgi:DNA/RNA endonuclease YhcR with UshA esterase domain